MNNSFWWQLFADLNAQIATLTMVMWIFALIHALNTMDFAPVSVLSLFVGAFWFISSWARRFG